MLSLQLFTYSLNLPPLEGVPLPLLPPHHLTLMHLLRLLHQPGVALLHLLWLLIPLLLHLPCHHPGSNPAPAVGKVGWVQSLGTHGARIFHHTLQPFGTCECLAKLSVQSDRSQKGPLHLTSRVS